MKNDGKSACPAFAPEPHLERLLQAVLCRDVRATEAFAAWESAMQFDDIPSAHFRLMGELAEAVDRLSPDHRERARLLGIKKYVWSNNIHIVRMVLPVIEAFRTEGIPFAVLKGGGVIAADHTALHRRFIRDIDLMVHEKAIPDAVGVLLRLGWRPVTGRIPGSIRAQPFDREIPGNSHEMRRVEIDLHRSALHFGRQGRFDDEFFGRMQDGMILGRPVAALHPCDAALVAVTHGLIHDDDPTYVWITDAVRAFRHPKFDWDVFAEALERRSIGQHTGAVLAYLEETFGIDLPSGFQVNDNSGWRRWLFDREVTAIGRNRRDRGWHGRLAMLLAETVRSKALVRSVGYRTDYGQKMNRSAKRSPDDMRFGEVRYRLKGESTSGKLSVEVLCGPTGKGRMELDVWHGDRWLARLRLRTALSFAQTVEGIWQAEVDVGADTDRHAIRVVEAF